MEETKFDGMALGCAEGAEKMDEFTLWILMMLFLSVGIPAPDPGIQKMKEDMAEMRGKMSVIEKMIGGK